MNIGDEIEMAKVNSADTMIMIFIIMMIMIRLIDERGYPKLDD